MKIRKDRLSISNASNFLRLRFFHFDNHVTCRPYFFSTLKNGCTRGFIEPILISASNTCIRLDENLVALAHQYFSTHRSHAYAVFISLYFSWYSNNGHHVSPFETGMVHDIVTPKERPVDRSSGTLVFSITRWKLYREDFYDVFTTIIHL